MRKVFLCLSMLLVLGITGCVNGKTDFEGKWKKATNDSKSFVLELTPKNGWKYYVDNKMVEEGTFVKHGDKFIMKHKVEEHSEHDHGHDNGKGHGHSHKAEPDHEYGFSLSSDKKQLKLMHDGKTSVYNKQ
ncbi:MAG: hypothetical protein GY854_16620 [Deltaproteobacteria bacterium]|nr:hypothetical protein [Deltaproteobacteria bacterium]